MNSDDSIAIGGSGPDLDGLSPQPPPAAPLPGAAQGTPPRRRRWLANAALVSASALFALLALEGAMRLAPALQLQTGDGEYRFCGAVQKRHQPHVAFGYTEYPGNSYFERYSALDPWAYVHINAEGFRDNMDNGGEPVFVLGDSLTRGTLVNEPENFSGLLERWRQDFSFRTFGTGGYGQANEIRLYDEKGKAAPHRLVIAQYSLSTDIDDNVERAQPSGPGVRIDIAPAIGTPRTEKKLVARVHLFLWQNSKLYPWIYNATVRPFVSNWDARRDMAGALDVTRRLMVRLEEDVQANGADLLVLVLPSWAEMAGRDDGMAPEAQRAMLQRFVTDNPGVFLLDMTPILRREDPNRTYGRIDKHLTPYGHYLVARALDRWLSRDWPRGPQTAPVAHPFPPPMTVTPRCDLAPEYQRPFTDLPRAMPRTPPSPAPLGAPAPPLAVGATA